MQIIGCGKGHYYNPELYSSCPECAKANGGSIGATEPVGFGNFGGGSGSIGATEPVDFGGFGGGSGSIGATEPVGGFGGGSVGATEPAGFGPFGGGSIPSVYTDVADAPKGGYGATEPVGGFGNKGVPGSFSGVEEYGATMPVMPEGMTGGPGPRGAMPFMPVVGWLVCVEGPAKGRDYRIHSNYNYIGRGQHMDICISGDDHISKEKAAIIAYDALERCFFFGPGMGQNLVRVNGTMLMNAVPLKAYDELTIGKTKLLFVPLCGERFDWNDK